MYGKILTGKCKKRWKNLRRKMYGTISRKYMRKSSQETKKRREKMYGKIFVRKCMGKRWDNW